jgi:bifunctional DNA-binding transcriptional regulator/antitoxin component of YhaV-PrlF toxin-antitoxin module
MVILRTLPVLKVESDGAIQLNLWHQGRNLALGGEMTNLPKSVEIHLGRQGRLVIPVALRQLLGFEEGDTLIAREQSGRLVLEKQTLVKQRLKARFAKVSKERSLVDELIAERREAAQREVAE